MPHLVAEDHLQAAGDPQPRRRRLGDPILRECLPQLLALPGLLADLAGVVDDLLGPLPLLLPPRLGLGRLLQPQQAGGLRLLLRLERRQPPSDVVRHRSPSSINAGHTRP
jgi:hypothetical protein